MPDDVIPVDIEHAADIYSIEQQLGSIGIKYTFIQVTPIYDEFIPIARVYTQQYSICIYLPFQSGIFRKLKQEEIPKSKGTKPRKADDEKRKEFLETSKL